MYCTCVSIKVKELKKGEFFTLKDVTGSTFIPHSVVWVRGEYDRSSKKYECYKYDDVNHFSYLRAERVVYTDFVF
ncbi:MAG: hypothetical protein IJ172_08625 [Ruminococcus sp.]|nr:hypothetical protein [Ruminococcus sp.]